MATTAYIKVLYDVPVSDLWAVPSIPGVYILSDDSNIYCGSSGSLMRRSHEIIREQGFGQRFSYFCKDLCNPSHKVSKNLSIRAIETRTISALHTIILGNGIPLNLTNDRDVSWLPSAAWSKNRELVYSIALDIAQTALRQMGVPIHMTQLPYYYLFQSNLLSITAVENKARWAEIIRKELSKRADEGGIKHPLSVMSPI